MKNHFVPVFVMLTLVALLSCVLTPTKASARTGASQVVAAKHKTSPPVVVTQVVETSERRLSGSIIENNQATEVAGKTVHNFTPSVRPQSQHAVASSYQSHSAPHYRLDLKLLNWLRGRRDRPLLC